MLPLNDVHRCGTLHGSGLRRQLIQRAGRLTKSRDLDFDDEALIQLSSGVPLHYLMCSNKQLDSVFVRIYAMNGLIELFEDIQQQSGDMDSALNKDLLVAEIKRSDMNHAVSCIFSS